MARIKRNKNNSEQYLGSNPYPRASSHPQGTDPYAYLHEPPHNHTPATNQPQAPTEPPLPANVHGFRLADHVDPSIPQAPDSPKFLPQEQATDGGFVPTQPRKPGKRPAMLTTALGVMRFIAFCLLFFTIFLVMELLPDTGLFSPRPMMLADKILLAFIAVFTVAAVAMPVFIVLAYQRLWAALGVSVCAIAAGIVLIIADTGFTGYIPIGCALLCFMPQNVRYYGRTRQYRRQAKAYGALVEARAVRRAS